MAFNITEFKSNAGELLRPYSYKVNIAPPAPRRVTGAPPPSNPERDLSFRTESITLPGVSFAEVDNHKIYGNGLAISIPHSTTVQEITCVHNVDSEGETLQTFYDWANQIVNIDGSGDIFGQGKFSAYYYDDYVAPQGFIEVYKLNGGFPVKTYTLYNVYPAAYDQLQMSWGSTGEVAQLSVTYKFESFSVS